MRPSEDGCDVTGAIECSVWFGMEMNVDGGRIGDGRNENFELGPGSSALRGPLHHASCARHQPQSHSGIGNKFK